MHVTDHVCPEKWDAVARQSPWSTFYHTYAWARILEASFDGCRPAPRFFTMDDGTEVLVPGVELPACRGLLKEYYSMHAGAYGGPVSAVKLSQGQVDEVFTALYAMESEQVGVVVVHTNPYGPMAPTSGYKLIRDCTYGIRLDGGFETVWNERMSRNMRRGIKRAREAGIELRVDNSDWAVDALYDLYLLSARRWGEKTTWLRPKRLCENAARLGGENVKVRVALLDGRPIGASMDYCYGQVSLAGWRAFDIDYKHCYPNALLVASAVEDACNAGLSYYDMGASASLGGVTDFKQRCGAVAYEFHTCVHEKALYRTYGLLRRSVRGAQGKVHSLASA